MTNIPQPPVALEERESEGEKKFSPSAARNQSVIADTLLPFIPQGATVLEIASGTGEHAAHFCQIRPDLNWQPTDPDASSRASQNAWAAEAAGCMRPSVNIDTTQEGWWDIFHTIDVIYCANMIHIAPWSAAKGMVTGAAHILGAGQFFALYGPFLEEGDTAPSNLAFDQSLKSRNPEWGVRSLRSVKHIFADAGFNMEARIHMPKENQLLIFVR